ncbi:response regulator [Pseudodesulfovibrio sp.]|uniref:response regulator n=1 Tax=Pseudodesulfovibrio sp. TaxID=2035812 RepID=UPI002622F02A|nr:response regulator [Pseudodesulfovibrio sp.]MDD3313102.1 response regulator [Pseudodesulfovibrio sp.]
MRILLVDDEVELVSAMAERLGFRDIEADWAANAEDALVMAEGKAYDVAVLDMKMPRIGGLELRRMLSERHPAMKFIFLSGHGSESDFKTGSAEAENYLIKPINLESLVEKINEAVK